MRKLTALVLLALAALLTPTTGFGQFDPDEPTRNTEGFHSNGPSYRGEDVTDELPPSQHLKNKAGYDGLGLCVFTSVELNASWSNVRALYGFRDWMTHREGGGYPDKLDRMITQYCRERNQPVPSYIQHTGGSMDFLKMALAAGRYPCVVYAGHDGVNYSFRIAHMVNLVHLSDKWAVIQDNNFPGQWLWMPVDSFTSRWRELGGWAFVLLAPPPPPIPANQVAVMRGTTVPVDEWEDVRGITCPEADKKDFEMPVDPTTFKYQWRQTWREQVDLYRNNVQVGSYRYSDGLYLPYDAKARQWGVPTRPPVALPVGARSNGSVNYGVMVDMIDKGVTYNLNGQAVHANEAMMAMVGGPFDDTSKPRLTAVGDKAFQAQAAQLVSTLVAGTVLFQAYDPTEWAPAGVGLPAGLTLQSPPDKAGIGAVLWRSGSLPTADQLKKDVGPVVEGLRRVNPNYDPAKDPAPPSQVKPVDPSGPTIWHCLCVAFGMVLYRIFASGPRPKQPVTKS